MTATNVFEIADMLVAHATKTCPDDVCLIAYYGSHAKGTATATSDLDLFYVSDKGHIKGLTSQFIMAGLPYDFWPLSWEMLTDIANAASDRPWAVSASLLADAIPLYQRSAKDLARFTALQNQLAALKESEKRPLMIAKAFAAFKEVGFQLGQLRSAIGVADRMEQVAAGWRVVNATLNCLALVNQTYFRKGWGACLPEALELAQRPAALESLVLSIITPKSKAGRLAAAEELVIAVRDILRAAQLEAATPVAPQDVFADSYFFIHEYKQKILSACERQDIVTAAYAAFQLQIELCEWFSKVENGFWPTSFNYAGEYALPYYRRQFPDLLDAAVAGDLAKLAEQVVVLDKVAKAWYETNGIDLNILSSVAALRPFLQQRTDPQ